MQETLRGKVKFWNDVKGYGFIASDSLERDVFVHVVSLARTGITWLGKDDRVEFTVQDFKGRIEAANVRLLKKEDA